MIDLVFTLLLGIAIGYGVRELISRERRRRHGSSEAR
jgi:hypothetical protein